MYSSRMYLSFLFKTLSDPTNSLVAIDPYIKNMHIYISINSLNVFISRHSNPMHKTGELLFILSWEICEVNVKEDKTIPAHSFLLEKHSRCFVRREKSL